SFAQLAHSNAFGFADRFLDDPNYIAYIDYTGPPGTIPRLSYEEALDDRYFKPESVRGKLVLVGITAKGEDEKPNPYSTSASGIEIHANALNGLLAGRFLRPTGNGIELLLDLILAILAGVIIGQARIGLGIAGTVAATVMYLTGSQLAFSGSGIVL